MQLFLHLDVLEILENLFFLWARSLAAYFPCITEGGGMDLCVIGRLDMQSETRENVRIFLKKTWPSL